MNVSRRILEAFGYLGSTAQVQKGGWGGKNVKFQQPQPFLHKVQMNLSLSYQRNEKVYMNKTKGMQKTKENTILMF